jgi:small conductance mechanosensitive channel
MYLDKLLDFAWNYGPKLLTALVMLFVGFWVIRRLTRAFQFFLRTRHIDPSLSPFFGSLVDIVLKVTLLLVVASTVGIQTTSFIALFSAIAFSIGLALQGSLGNFASGVLILLFRPYRVGDLVTVEGKTGRVQAIQIFSTILLTPQGRLIIVPNGKITEGSIENIASEAQVQAEISLLVELETDLALLRDVVGSVAKRCPTALPDREASVQIAGITRDDMKAQIAFYTLGSNYDTTLNFMYEELKLAFDAAGIELAKERRREQWQ